MPDQEDNRRFTSSAWNLFKSVRLADEEQDMMNLMIEARITTITLEEVKDMLYTVVHKKQ